MLYCPNKTNLFGEKCGTVPIKPKKTIFLSLPGLPAKKIGFIGTVQHFLKPRGRKCCTVPIRLKKPIFLSLPRASAKKIGFIGTVQHFLKPRDRKCCTVPIKPIFLVKSAVLSQLNQKNNLSQSSKSISQKDWFYWNSTALSASGLRKVLYIPNKTNLFGR